jgi:hypothetical protein
MMKNFLKAICVFTLVSILFACSSHISPSPKLAELHHKDFTKALRWKQFKVAASHMDEELRKPFLTTFKELKDIDIIDVRLAEIQFVDENNRFEASIEMDYILLPSVTLKTFQFDQTWEFREGANKGYAVYVITSPFPKFP